MSLGSVANQVFATKLQLSTNACLKLVSSAEADSVAMLIAATAAHG